MAASETMALTEAGGEADAPTPTPEPTDEPTAAPRVASGADEPTDEPSDDEPTEKPADKPTDKPTDPPTDEAKSSDPTDKPTDKPTGDLTSGDPTGDLKSGEPTDKPTDKPTDDPESGDPTDAPTDKPTDEPTGDPTDTPTDEPTDDPESGDPTDTPTDKPTNDPTDTPTSPSPDPSTSPDPVLVASVTLSLTPDPVDGQPENALFVGDTALLSAAVLPEDAADPRVAFASSDDSILSIDENGLVAALAAGEATLTATALDAGGASASLTVTVVERPAALESLALTAESDTLLIGETLALTLSALPEDAPLSGVTLASSDDAVATVDAQAVVTGVSAGEAVVTATMGELSASVTLRVLPETPFAGEGTAESPYLIANRDELLALSALVGASDERCIGANYALTDDIRLGDGFAPIGTAEHPFEGVFDGRGYKLRGLMLLLNDAQDAAYGLFGVTRGATVIRVAVEQGDLNIAAGGADVGLLIGRMEGGSLERSYTTGTVETRFPDGATGGLVGRVVGGAIADCFSLAGVSARQNGGVLVGLAEDGAEIKRCYNRTEWTTADIERTVGGLQDVSLRDVYILSAEDDQAEALEYALATDASSYDDFDFGGVWTLDASADYPFPVLADNPYRGAATYGPAVQQEHALGGRPISEALRKSAQQAAYGVGLSAELPSAYDLRNVIDVPAVRDQNPYGTCWAHAILASLETNMIKRGMATSSVNLAELHSVFYVNRGARFAEGVFQDPLDNFNNDHALMPFDNILNGGGNEEIAMYTLATGMVPDEESGRTVYNNANAQAVQANGLPYSYAFDNDRVHVSQIRVGSATNRDQIKQMILDYGALTIDYTHDSNQFMSETYSYYAPANAQYSNESGGHAVSVVGWNDNYSRTNFITGMQPANDGAWLIRNSWGKSWGNDGYFWASYESDGFNNSACIAFIAEAPNDYDNCYQYDGTNSPDYNGLTSNTAYAANIFTAVAHEQVTDVGFWCTRMNGVAYSVDVYRLREGATNPNDGTLLTTEPTTGTVGVPGFYKVGVKTNDTLQTGERFSVVVRFKNDSQVVLDLDTDYSLDWMYNYSYAKRGQSLYSLNGTYWYDLNAGSSTTVASSGRNLRVKGYTKIMDYAESVSVSATGDAGTVTLGQPLQMKAAVLPASVSQHVTWSVTDVTGSATISANGLLTGVTPGNVMVSAETLLKSEAGEHLTDSMELTVVRPPVESIALYYGGNDVTDDEIAVNVARPASSVYKQQIHISSSALPQLAAQGVEWKLAPDPCDGAKIITTDDTGATVEVTGVCSPTLRATANDGSGVYAEVRINAYDGPTAVRVVGVEHMVGGSAQRLFAVVEPKGTAYTDVVWSLEDDRYARIGTDGTLTAARTSIKREVTVRATSVDKTIYGEMTVTLLPASAIGLELVQSGATTALTNGQMLRLQALGTDEKRLRLRADGADRVDGVTLVAQNANVVSIARDGADFVIRPVGFGTTRLNVYHGALGNTGRWVNVSVDQYAQSVTVSGQKQVAVGRSVKLTATALPLTAANRAVVWSVDCDKSIATISSSGTLKIKKATDRPITVTATAKDGGGASGTWQVEATPPTTSVAILDDDNTLITRKTLILDISKGETLGARAVTNAARGAGDASPSVTWKLSSSKLARLAIDGDADEMATLTPLATGTVTVTAKAADGTGKSNYFKVKIIRSVTQLRLEGAAYDANRWVCELGAGKSLSLAATALPTNATNRKLKWTLAEGAEGVKLSGSRLTAAKNTAGATVKLRVETQDGSALSQELYVTIAPAVTKTASIMHNGQSVTKLTLPCYAELADPSMTFAAVSDAGARFRWKVSSTKLCTLAVNADNTATVTPVKAGTVTLTATAVDGSGRSAYVKLKITKRLTGVAFMYPEAVAVGKTVKPTIVFTPADATNRKLKWTLGEGESDYATINASTGAVRAKVGGQLLHVTATALDASYGAATTVELTTVQTPVKTVQILRADSGAPSAKTVYASPVNGALSFAAATLPDAAGDSIVWSLSPKTSKAMTLTVDPATNIATLAPTGLAGSVTLRATATDGSGKSATVRVTYGNYVSDISLTADARALVQYGKTNPPTFRVYYSYLPVKASSPKLTWTVSHGGKARAASGYALITVERDKLSYPDSVAVTCTSASTGVSETILIPVVVDRVYGIELLYGDRQRLGDSVALAMGESLFIWGVTMPSMAYSRFAWESLNPDRVVVSDAFDTNGTTLTRVGAGPAVIQVSALDGFGYTRRLLIMD